MFKIWKVYLFLTLFFIAFSFLLYSSYRILLKLKAVQEVSSDISTLLNYVYVAFFLFMVMVIWIFYELLKASKKSKQEFLDEATGLLNQDYIKFISSKINLKDIDCIIAIEIENLIKIDNTYGETTTNEVLKQFIERLNKNIEDKDLAIRYNWNEFLVIRKKNPRVSCKEFLKSIKLSLEEELYTHKNIEIRLDFLFGLNKQINKMKNLDEAIKYTFVALSDAKKSNSKIGEFGKNKTNILPKLMEIKSHLDKNRISLLFQPIVDIQRKRIFKFEVLSRILNEKGAEIPPNQFLEVIKGTTIYTDFTNKILEMAIRYLYKYEDVELSVNLTASDIICGSAVKILRNVNNKSLLNRLTIEVLESEDIYNYDMFKENLEYIKYAGCKIALDDFGSGYSNFMYILEIKPDYLKIDGSIIKNVDSDKNAYILVKAIKDFADNAGIEVIAEYVSNSRILKILETIGIRYMQGYLFGKPMNTPQKSLPVLEEMKKAQFTKPQKQQNMVNSIGSDDDNWLEYVKWKGE